MGAGPAGGALKISVSQQAEETLLDFTQWIAF